MTASTTNRWKLGAFVSAGVLAGVGALFWLGARSYARETVRALTYFDESVQGLDPGSPVKFRGVRIGTVSRIAVARDVRHIEVASDLYADELRRLGALDDDDDGFLMPELRAQIASAGITGLKYLLIDFFDPKKVPPPALPFETPEFYLPAAPSTLKSVEDALTRMLDLAPDFGDQLLLLLRQTNDVLAQVKDEDLPADTKSLLAQAREVLERGAQFLDTAEGRLSDLDVAGLGAQAGGLLTDARETVARLRTGIDAFSRDDGRLASTMRSVESVAARVETDLAEANVGQTAAALRDSLQRVAASSERLAGLSDDLALTLERTRDSLDALRELSEMLRRDPGSLLHGRQYVPRGAPPPEGASRRGE